MCHMYLTDTQIQQNTADADCAAAALATTLDLFSLFSAQFCYSTFFLSFLAMSHYPQQKQQATTNSKMNSEIYVSSAKSDEPRESHKKNKNEKTTIKTSGKINK